MHSTRALLLASGLSCAAGAFISTSDNEFLSQERALFLRLKSYIFPRNTDFRNSPEVFLAKAIDISKGVKYAVLSTHSGGQLSSRAIEPDCIESDKTGHTAIYFNTNKLSRKHDEMSLNREVALTYLDCNKMAYVTFIGTVEKIPYPLCTKYWSDKLLMFYPEGNNETRGSRFTTWRLIPRRISMVDYSGGAVSERTDWRSPELQFDDVSRKWIVSCTGLD